MADFWKASFLDLERHLDETFEKLIYRRWAIPNPAEWRPPFDLHESAEGYVVEIDLPGVPADQVEIRVTEGELTLRGTRCESRFEETLRCHKERRCGPFRISLVLPHRVTPEKTQAEYRDGIYVIRLFKKRQNERPAQRTAAVQPEDSRGIRILCR
ncbi:MAG: Hsp20/alpha crystallin family protein [Isosphaeraceae bacterium]